VACDHHVRSVTLATPKCGAMTTTARVAAASRATSRSRGKRDVMPKTLQRCVRLRQAASFRVRRGSLAFASLFGTFRALMTSGVHVQAIWLFHRGGLWGASRMLHVIVGIMWMGLLWFFNFVQTPAYAEMEASARNNAFDKLTWRALWWFRWAAAAT